LIVIAFSGRARHGKTVAAEAILRHVLAQGGTGKLYDIGDMIRRYCITHGRLPQVERKDMTREQLEILINVGKEKRAVDVDFWGNAMVAQMVADNFDVALCPNARYASEATLFRGIGGYIVRCTRLNANGSIFISEDRPPNDVSETELEFWPADFYLTTKPDQEEFMARQAVTLYEYLKEGAHVR
jgi:hypothetical protein